MAVGQRRLVGGLARRSLSRDCRLTARLECWTWRTDVSRLPVLHSSESFISGRCVSAVGSQSFSSANYASNILIGHRCRADLCRFADCGLQAGIVRRRNRLAIPPLVSLASDLLKPQSENRNDHCGSIARALHCSRSKTFRQLIAA